MALCRRTPVYANLEITAHPNASYKLHLRFRKLCTQPNKYAPPKYLVLRIAYEYNANVTLKPRGLYVMHILRDEYVN